MSDSAIQGTRKSAKELADGTLRVSIDIEPRDKSKFHKLFNVACKAMNALEEIREIYTGMDGFLPKTTKEIYQDRIIRKMYDSVKKISD